MSQELGVEWCVECWSWVCWLMQRNSLRGGWQSKSDGMDRAWAKRDGRRLVVNETYAVTNARQRGERGQLGEELPDVTDDSLWWSLGRKTLAETRPDALTQTRFSTAGGDMRRAGIMHTAGGLEGREKKDLRDSS